MSVFSTVSQFKSITSDGTSLYCLSYYEQVVIYYNFTDITKRYSTMTTLNNPTGAVLDTIVVNDNIAYISAPYANMVYQLNLSNGEFTEFYSPDESLGIIYGPLCIYNGDNEVYILISMESPAGILRVPLSGGTPKILPNTSYNLVVSSMVIDGSYIYATNTTNSSIMRFSFFADVAANLEWCNTCSANTLNTSNTLVFYIDRLFIISKVSVNNNLIPADISYVYIDNPTSSNTFFWQDPASTSGAYITSLAICNSQMYASTTLNTMYMFTSEQLDEYATDNSTTLVYSHSELTSSSASVASSDENRNNYMARAMLYPKGKLKKGSPVGVIDTFNRTTRVMKKRIPVYTTTTETTITLFNDLNPLLCHFAYATQRNNGLKQKITSTAHDNKSTVSITPFNNRRLVNIQTLQPSGFYK
jgi:hypothetical protein